MKATRIRVTRGNGRYVNTAYVAENAVEQYKAQFENCKFHVYEDDTEEIDNDSTCTGMVYTVNGYEHVGIR